MTSVRKHLTRTLLGTAAALGGTGAAIMYFAAREAAVDQFDAALQAKALAVSTLTTPAPEGIHVTFTDHFMRGFDDRSPRDFFEIWDGAGRPLARSESLGQADLPRPRLIGEKAVFWNQRLPTFRPGRAIAFSFAPKVPGLRKVGVPVFLMVASDCSGLNEDLWRLIAIALASGAVLLGATFWLIPRVLWQGLQPLDRLGERAAAIDSHSLATRFSVGDLPEELRPIAGRLNDLLGRIEQSFERERRFSADLAHELRTPLAELRSLVECSLRWPETRDSGEDREILAISTQMEGMVSHMLALARSEQGQLPVRIERLELDQIAGERWARLAARAADRGLNVQLNLEPTPALADLTLLRSILDNVLENAVDHSAVPGLLRISVRTEIDGAVFCVENSSSNLGADDISRLFERFWRKEAARTGGQHVGLGLPLARAFANAMGWKLTAALSGSEVLAVTLAESRQGPPSPEKSNSALSHQLTDAP
jgi:signal transduction histidine kinase